MQKMERMPGDAIHVCVDAYPNRVLQGRLQSAAWVGEMPFVSLMDFFKQVEHLLDEQLPPQAFTTMRRFGPVVKPEKTHGEVEQSASGKLATFYVRILAERQLAGHRPLVRGQPGGTLPQRLGAGPAPGQRPGAGERAQVAAVLQHEKKKRKRNEPNLDSFLLVREAGLEPARAYCTLEPESSESANSTTRAHIHFLAPLTSFRKLTCRSVQDL